MLTVLNTINLTIEAGEMVAIVGTSGSGKSTLMNIIGCLDRPSRGIYRVNGQETGALEPDELAYLRREYFGFIFQRYHLLNNLDALANVEIPAIYAGMARITSYNVCYTKLLRSARCCASVLDPICMHPPCAVGRWGLFVITSYSIHYTKLYDFDSLHPMFRCR